MADRALLMPQSMEQQLPGSPAGIDAYTGVWDTPQVVHLLKRTLFGAAMTDVNYFKTRTMSQAVDELLQPSMIRKIQ